MTPLRNRDLGHNTMIVQVWFVGIRWAFYKTNFAAIFFTYSYILLLFRTDILPIYELQIRFIVYN